MKNLVIVESPAKAKTIEKFLGKDYKVMSSYGHIRDLKKRELSIDEQTMDPVYEIPEEKKKLVGELRSQAKKADHMKTVFLHNMTDQMLEPTFDIEKDVTALSNYHKGTGTKSVNQLVDNIQKNGDTITQILNNLINLSEEEMNQEKGGES